MPTFNRKKKGGEGTLNSHIENYIKAEKDDDQKAMDHHKTLYMNAYARHMDVQKMIEQKLAFGLLPSRNVINPRIQASFDKRVKDEKNAQEDANKLEQKRQEEIIRRNLEKDKMEQMNKKNMKKSGAFHENVTPQTKKAASNRFIQMRIDAEKRGRSILSQGGKRKTRKLNRGGMKKRVRTTRKSSKKVYPKISSNQNIGLRNKNGKRYAVLLGETNEPIINRRTNKVNLYDYKTAINKHRLKKLSSYSPQFNPQGGEVKRNKKKSKKKTKKRRRRKH